MGQRWGSGRSIPAAACFLRHLACSSLRAGWGRLPEGVEPCSSWREWSDPGGGSSSRPGQVPRGVLRSQLWRLHWRARRGGLLAGGMVLCQASLWINVLLNAPKVWDLILSLSLTFLGVYLCACTRQTDAHAILHLMSDRELMGNPGFIMILYHFYGGRQEKRQTKNICKHLVCFQLILNWERSIYNQHQRFSNEQIIQISPKRVFLSFCAWLSQSLFQCWGMSGGRNVWVVSLLPFIHVTKKGFFYVQTRKSSILLLFMAFTKRWKSFIPL